MCVEEGRVQGHRKEVWEGKMIGMYPSVMLAFHAGWPQAKLFACPQTI